VRALDDEQDDALRPPVQDRAAPAGTRALGKETAHARRLMVVWAGVALL